MTQLDSYLFFDGQCAEAMRFYERVLGAKLEMSLTYAQSPVPAMCPEGSADRVMHARLAVGGRYLMASDVPAGEATPMQGFSLSLIYPTADEARRIFDALANGGKVRMAMTGTFWADAYGMLTDRFGTPWMVGGGMRDPS